MKSRSRLIAALGIALLLTASVAAFTAWQWRALYVSQLIEQVWPAGHAKPVELAAPGDHKTPTVLLLGDSRIAQWNLPRPAAGRVVNAGLLGATTARVAQTSRDFLERFRPDVVVIEAGINDLKLAGARPDLAPEIIAEAEANLARLVERSRSFGARVLVLLVWPAAEPSLLRRPVWNAAAVSGAVEDLNTRLRKLHAPENGVVVCDLLAEARGDIVYQDTLHLQPTAYERLAPILQSRIEQLLATPAPVR